MSKQRLQKSLRKYIRKEKARIRREVFDSEEREKLIDKLYQDIFDRYKIKENKNKSK